MTKFLVAAAAALALSACSGGSGNPFASPGGDDGADTSGTVPAELAGDVTSFVYDPAAETLIVKGESLDDTPYEAVYQRKPALDVPGYQAYSSQESSLGRHHTAYVQEIDGTRGGVIGSGPLYGHVFAGAYYERDGSFDPPDVTAPGGIVQYAGTYVGLMNAGSSGGGDLLPVAPGTDPAILPTQAYEVTGKIIISADFADNVADGIVYDRVIPDLADDPVENLELAPAAIDADGRFSDDITQGGGARVVGTWGGIFGGTDAAAVAGATFAREHMDGYSREEEYGTFVLGQCGTADADPVCSQPHP